MLKNLSRMKDREVYIKTKSPLEQNSNYKFKMKEIGEDFKPLNEYENSVIVFDDILGLSNYKYLHQFFIRGRHNSLDLSYLSQSCFELPKRAIRNNSYRILLFSQTLKDIEKKTEDVRRYNMSCNEYKQLCKKLRKMIIILYVLIDQKKIEEDKVIVMKAKRLTLIVHLKEIHSMFLKTFNYIQ